MQSFLGMLTLHFFYKCRVKAQNDVVSENFGIRELSWGEKGICINKERIIIQGACVHHDNGLLGAVCDPDAIERKVRLMKENGYNAIKKRTQSMLKGISG